MTLEAAYRRRLRLFPKAWKVAHEEEVVGVLLEAAPSGQHSVPLGDTIDLVLGALRVRLRRARTATSPRVVASSMAGLAVVGLSVIVLGRSTGIVSPEFLATSLIVVLVPGTGVVYTVSSAIGGGWRRGFVAAVGCTLGIVPHMLAAMLGLSGVMQAGATLFEVVRWIGVAYLVFMGVSMIRSGGALQLGDDTGAVDQRTLAVVRRGILLNVLNPKLTIFFFAFLPQFLDSTPQLLNAQLVLLGLVFMAMTLAVFVGYAYMSATVRDRVVGSPNLVRWMQRSLGALLVGFAARLAVVDR
jgi:threonine/homoserine/homoserine lactone efflux protein